MIQQLIFRHGHLDFVYAIRTFVWISMCMTNVKIYVRCMYFPCSSFRKRVYIPAWKTVSWNTTESPSFLKDLFRAFICQERHIGSCRMDIELSSFVHMFLIPSLFVSDGVNTFIKLINLYWIMYSIFSQRAMNTCRWRKLLILRKLRKFTHWYP